MQSWANQGWAPEAGNPDVGICKEFPSTLKRGFEGYVHEEPSCKRLITQSSLTRNSDPKPHPKKQTSVVVVEPTLATTRDAKLSMKGQQKESGGKRLKSH